MRYALLICTDETELEPMSPAQIMADPTMRGWASDLEQRGVMKGGERLRPASDATTIRVRDGEVLTSDGPFAETKEVVGGFNIIDCADLDEAIDIAAHHPAAQLGAVEVRPIWELEP